MKKITSIQPNSHAARAEILSGDVLLSVNGQTVVDVLDYRFHMTERQVELELSRDGNSYTVTIKKGEYDDLGLEFEDFLMDKQRACANRCIFCFVDQNAPECRETLHFKDDDWRMSFLWGNYITTTNMTDSDLDRIIAMRTSPMNISVHTTNPQLRVKMLGNPRAANIMDTLRRLDKADIAINCQIVLCCGVNDGAELDRTMSDLAAFYPNLQSVSIVPAGITRHREGLFPLTEFTSAQAAGVIAQVDDFADKCHEEHGERLFFCADELYIRAGLPIPAEEHYQGYPQLENGVGMMRSFAEEVEFALEEAGACYPPRKLSIATGAAAHKFISKLVDRVGEVCYNSRRADFDCTVYQIRNDYLGQSVTVAGLVAGGDIIAQLAGKDFGEQLLIPRTMLRHDGEVFLDDVTIAQVEDVLGVTVVPVEVDGAAFVEALAGAE